jgi:serine/threonine protein phosphatase PrpC
MLGRTLRKNSEVDANSASSHNCRVAQPPYLPGQGPLSFFLAMLDGHGPNGKYVANTARDRLVASAREAYQDHQRQQQRPEPGDVLWEGFAAAHRFLTDSSGVDVHRSGSTASVALLDRGKLTVACAGDCRCVVGMVDEAPGAPQSQEPVPYPYVMTYDHRPDVVAERKRVELAGGRVDSIRDRHTGQAKGPLRVWLQHQDAPGLMVTRSLGDGLAHTVGVSEEPEVFSCQLTKSVRFLIIASDGIWDMVSR